MTSIKKAKWLDVPYIIRELLIVIVGILIAIWINAWWNGLENARLEAALLDQLGTDLARAEEQLAGAAAGSEASAQSVLMVIGASRADSVVSNDSLIAWLSAAGAYADAIPSLSVAQGLATTNDLQLIQSVDVRIGVVDLLDEVRQAELRLIPFEQRVISTLQAINRIVEPLDRGRQRWVGSWGNPPDSLSRETRLIGETKADLRPLLRTPEFRALLDELYIAHENLRWYQQAMLNATRSLRGAVELAGPAM